MGADHDSAAVCCYAPLVGLAKSKKALDLLMPMSRGSLKPRYFTINRTHCS